MKKVVIIGGGISGLFSAYYLNRLNYDVTIIDNANFSYGCSHGNAGLIVPSHIIPLAAPGMISLAFKWMLNPYSPFSFHPKLNKDFVDWCLKFFQKANKQHVKDSILPLRNISFLSSNLYKEVAEEFNNSFSLNSKGLLMLYKNASVGEEEIKLAKLAEENGISTNCLSKDEINSLDKNCNYNVLSGIHYLSDSHLSPDILLNNLVRFLKSKQIEFVSDEKIKKINLQNNLIESVEGDFKKYNGDAFLFSAGVWSSELLKSIDLKIPLMSGKGYSFNIMGGANYPTIPSILVDARVAVTPMSDNLRIAGTMEIDTINKKIRMNRIKGMVNSFKKYYPNVDIQLPTKDKVWYGLRPCSPDGLPFIGQSPSFKNLFVAAGHAMLGLSLGPATGKLISEIISEQSTSINIESFRVDRYN